MIFSLLAAVIISECMVRLPLPDRARDVQEIFSKVRAVFFSPRISDHWKERVLLLYSRIIFVLSCRVLGYLLLLSGIVLVFFYAFSFLDT